MSSFRALVVGLLLHTASCSLLVDKSADQCASDLDCTRFSGTFCDRGVHLCKPLDPSMEGTSDGGANDGVQTLDASSLDACSAIANFENACTNATCRPFNNRMRLTRLPLDGGLTPLPARDSGSFDSGKEAASVEDAGRIDAVVDDAWRSDATTEAAGKVGN